MVVIAEVVVFIGEVRVSLPEVWILTGLVKSRLLLWVWCFESFSEWFSHFTFHWWTSSICIKCTTGCFLHLMLTPWHCLGCFPDMCWRWTLNLLLFILFFHIIIFIWCLRLSVGMPTRVTWASSLLFTLNRSTVIEIRSGCTYNILWQMLFLDIIIFPWVLWE